MENVDKVLKIISEYGEIPEILIHKELNDKGIQIDLIEIRAIISQLKKEGFLDEVSNKFNTINYVPTLKAIDVLKQFGTYSNYNYSLSKITDKAIQVKKPAPTPLRRLMTIFLKTIGTIIVALITAYLIFKFGWN